MKDVRVFSNRYHCRVCAQFVWRCRCRDEGLIESNTRHLVICPPGCLMVAQEASE